MICATRHIAQSRMHLERNTLDDSRVCECVLLTLKLGLGAIAAAAGGKYAGCWLYQLRVIDNKFEHTSACDQWMMANNNYTHHITSESNVHLLIFHCPTSIELFLLRAIF